MGYQVLKRLLVRYFYSRVYSRHTLSVEICQKCSESFFWLVCSQPHWSKPNDWHVQHAPYGRTINFYGLGLAFCLLCECCLYMYVIDCYSSNHHLSGHMYLLVNGICVYKVKNLYLISITSMSAAHVVTSFASLIACVRAGYSILISTLNAGTNVWWSRCF